MWVTKDVTKQIDEEDYDDDIKTYDDPSEEELEQEENKIEDYKSKRDQE